MSCYHPITAYTEETGGITFNKNRGGDAIELPCGMCIGCRMRRASDWTLRCMHEAQMHEENCFVTLTYGTNALPPNSSLDHGDVQRFLKRIRKRKKQNIRFYMCGEYGPINQRPHYHMCLFGTNFYDRTPAGKSSSGEIFYDSYELTKLWGHGKCSVQDLTKETASYCARYIMKKQLGKDSEFAYSTINDDGEIIFKKPEYNAMSLKPGIGAKWYDKYKYSDVYPQDFIIADGTERRPPKYYDKLLKRSQNVILDDIQHKRQQRAKLAALDNTDERRKVREEVHLAKVKTLTRNLE